MMKALMRQIGTKRLDRNVVFKMDQNSLVELLTGSYPLLFYPRDAQPGCQMKDQSFF